ncbi:MAG: class I SAM-dependent methyltransferase [Roseimicrobium sp.]
MSNPWHLAPVLHYLGAVKPTRVLDVGIGTGSYGFMTRQFFDIGLERLNPADWQLVIDGVELFEPYRNPIWAYAYNNVMMGDIRDLLPTLGSYDVILCNDVLEHFPLEESQELVRNLLQKAPVVIATTPSWEMPQGAWGGNEAETHHCCLRPQDMPALVASKRTGNTSLYVSCTDAELTKKIEEASETILETRPTLATSARNLSKRACHVLTRAFAGERSHKAA